MNRNAVQTVPESSEHTDLIYRSFSWRGFSGSRGLLITRRIVSSRLGVSKDGADEWFTCCMAARGHTTRSRRELSLSNVVRHVIQGRSRWCSGDGGRGGGFRIIRAISGGFVAGIDQCISCMCISMRMTPLVRIIRRCRNDATEKSRYAARCTVRYVYGQRVSVNRLFVRRFMLDANCITFCIVLKRLDRLIDANLHIQNYRCTFFRQSCLLFIYLILDILAIRILLLKMTAIIK